jgi:hypothetical protein
LRDRSAERKCFPFRPRIHFCRLTYSFKYSG